MYRDRLYHGFFDRERDRRNQASDADEYAEVQRILVEKPAGGPTERRSVKVLYELLPPDAARFGGFHWGYHGTGPSRVAAAVLADSLELPADTTGRGPFAADDPVLGELSAAFVVDVVSELCDEWRLRCTLVMRWARAWYLHNYPAHLPVRLHQIPNASW